MTDKRLRQLFAALVAVVLLSTAAAPLTAFGDDLPPPASSVVAEPPAPPPREPLVKAIDATAIETSTADSTPPSEVSSVPTVPDAGLPVGGNNQIAGSSGNLIVGSSGNLIVGSSGNLPMMMYSRDDYTCSVGATVSFVRTTINYANGDPIVTLKLERLVDSKVKQTWFVTRRFEEPTVAKEFRFENLPLGSYRLTQLPVIRYEQFPYRPFLGEVTCSWGATCDFNKVTAWYNFYFNGSTGQAFIYNKQTTADWLSDTDLAVNKIMLPQGGGGCEDDDDDHHD